jgi:hypothetical protein
MGEVVNDPLDGLTLGQLKLFAEQFGLSGVAGSIRRATASTYEQFTETLYSDLNEVVLSFQENPELRRNDGEDRLTIEIVNVLRGMGYNAGHETKIGGHTDLSVRGKNNYLWIGEAKIHSSYDYLFQGFQQLCTRYATGDVNQDSGGLIIYITKNKSSSKVITTWRERLSRYGLDGLEINSCPKRPDFEFNSTHMLERTGTPFKVKHIGVSLFFDPQDKD